MGNTSHEANLENLRVFLNLDHCASAVLEKFAALPGAVSRMEGDGMDYVYIPSTRENPVLMVAHADVVEDDGALPEL